MTDNYVVEHAVTLKLKRLPHGVGVALPTVMTAHAAGMDVCAAVADSIMM